MDVDKPTAVPEPHEIDAKTSYPQGVSYNGV